MIPQSHETAFQFCVLSILEITKEFLQNSSLIFIKITVIIQFMKISNIDKNLSCITKIFIQVIKISQQKLPPTIKMIERFINTCAFHKRLVQVTD